MSTQAKTARAERIRITMSGDKLSATLMLRIPREEDEPYSVDEIHAALAAQDIVFGIKEDAILRMVTDELYAKPIVVAEGIPPQPGIPAKLSYHFDTEQKHTPKEDEDGRIDYRDISFIQKTHEGDVLVTKEPPKRGEPGKNICGKEIQGPLGRETYIQRGAATKLSDDGLTLTTAGNGAIVYQRGKVSVSTITTIKGDVDHAVGNIDCAGSVRVTGDIKAGFVIKVDGNLEVNGNVEDADIDVTGNILIKGGFFGQEQGSMRAENDIVMKYAEGQRIIAGGDVVVGGEIINCRVEAGGKILVKGSHGKIVGGELRAVKEIRAAVIGSEALIPTILRVGWDAELMQAYHDTLAEIRRITEDGARVKHALYGLYRLQMDDKLSPEKEIVLKQLSEFMENMPGELEELGRRKSELEEEMAKFTDACVIAEQLMYPGVKSYFGIVYRELDDEESRCKLTLEGRQVLVSTLTDK